MLRDKNLIPLSHQHQHALSLCVRIERAGASTNVEEFQSEIERMWDTEMRFHFAAEEKFLFPLAEQMDGMRSLTEELRAEHAVLRSFADSARERTMDAAILREFAARLSEHIRKEERQLFEGLQQALTAEQMSALGAGMAEILAAAPGASCTLRQDKQDADSTEEQPHR